MVIHHGLLLGLQPSYHQLGLIAPDKARQILEGASASEIPSSRLEYFQMTANLKTACNIGVQIPMSILVMANRIIR